MSCQTLASAFWDLDVDSLHLNVMKACGCSFHATGQICGNWQIPVKNVVSTENTVFRPENTARPEAATSAVLSLRQKIGLRAA